MSERLKELRVKNKLSQTKLAAELGISQFTVTSIGDRKADTLG